MMLLSSRSCEACDKRVSLLTEVRWQSRRFCGHACAAAVRDAHLKARFDAQDPSPTICRCAGAPVPLEPAGPHCGRCRRMFSAQLRLWLGRRVKRNDIWGLGAVTRWLDELAWQLGLRSST